MSTVLAALLKPILGPLMLLFLRVVARCGLLLVRRLPDGRVKRFLTVRF